MERFNTYKFMFYELVRRDFILKYKRTFLGVLWSVLSPMMLLSIQILVFTNFFGSDIPHYTIFLFSGNLIYSYFSEATQSGLMALAANASIFAKVPMPKYLCVFSRNVASLINFALTLCIFFVFVYFDGLSFNWKYVLLIYAIFCMVVFNNGISLLLASLYMLFRDLSYLYNIFVLGLMYLSAVFYSVEIFSPWVRQLFLLNPLYVYINYFRLIIINGVIPGASYHLLMILYSLMALGAGWFVYKKYNNDFLYYI